MTYIAPGDVITLVCDDRPEVVRLKVIRAGEHKIRLSIEAGKDVKITKGKTKRRLKK
jgi:sRNA-binding carbon storage regulator CsrA